MCNSTILSLVVPVYFEQECIEQFIAECTAELDALNFEYEIVFVDDGSKDQTVPLIKLACSRNPRIRLVELSYNHGKQAAVSAAITFAKGDYLLYMDPDLQDPPSEIIRFWEKIHEGYDLVFGIREEKRDTFFNRLFSRCFWKVLRTFTGLPIPNELAVMRIFNRKFAEQFLRYREANRFIEGIFMHIGMRRTEIVIRQRDRFAGVTKFTPLRKLSLAYDAIVDFSSLPLAIATHLGFLVASLSMLALVAIVAAKLLFIDFQAGWASLISILACGFGLQFFFLGVMGKYIGNIYKEVKMRPLFSIKCVTNLDESK